MEFDEVLKNRRSIREFKKKKISESNLLEIADAGRYAPSAGNLQNWKFLILTKKLDKLFDDFVSNASAVIVVINDKENIIREYENQGEFFSQQSCGAAIQNMLLKATDLGIGSCWVGSFEDKNLRANCNIDEKEEIVALVALGYSDEEAEFERRDLRDLVKFEKL